jgi:Mrp family chromosome partitioning ATPase
MLQMPEARVIGRLVSAVVLVLRSGQTTRDAAQAALQRLHEDGTVVLGTILNDWNPKSSTNGYYGYGRSTYSRPYGTDDESS